MTPGPATAPAAAHSTEPAQHAEDAAALAPAAQALGLNLADADLAQLSRYIDLLLRWNGTYNLTAVRDRPGIRLQHIIDCLAVVAPLRRHDATGTVRRVLDVGSGGGLPGIVLALLFPHWAVVCVDTVGKKAAFIRQAALELGLRNLSAEHARVEALRLPGFDLITCRAFSSLPDFVGLTERHLAPGGHFMAMKGKPPTDELAGLPAGIEVFHVEHLAVPGLSAERCLVWMRPRP